MAACALSIFYRGFINLLPAACSLVFINKATPHNQAATMTVPFLSSVAGKSFRFAVDLHLAKNVLVIVLSHLRGIILTKNIGLLLIRRQPVLDRWG